MKTYKMSIITKEQDYIIRVIRALYEGKDWMNAEDISYIEHIPKTVVFKMVRVLKAKDIIDSKSGQGGGYKLKVNIKDISVLECIRLLDLDFSINSCIKHSECKRKHVCMVNRNLENLQRELRERMFNISIYDLIYTNLEERRESGEIKPVKLGL